MTEQYIALTREEFEVQHKDYLSNPLIRAAFSAGYLVEKLLEAQRKHIDSEPFRKNLLNLNLDKKRLMDILVKCDQKMHEYMRMKEYGYLSMYDDMKAQTMALLVSTNDPIDKTEFSYAFTLGMVMQKAFAKESARKAKAKKLAEQAQNDVK